MIPFRPKLLDTLPGYHRNAFAADLSAGLTVGVLALPLAMAFAIASGLDPAAGIWTAIVAGLLISLLGGSSVQIGGPTGAFIPIVYAIVVDHGVANLMVATAMSGILLFAMGATRLGSMIRFIPLSVVIGFTNGIAVVIFLSQVRDFFGLEIDSLPGEFFARLGTLVEHAHTVDPPTLMLSVASLTALLLWRRAGRRFTGLARLPAPLVVLVGTTALNALLQWPVATIGSRFGGIPRGLPEIGLTTISPSLIGSLISPALTIALLGAIESLLSARVADGQTGDRHNPNQELMAQGVANMVAPLFGGFAATGAIARTATNIRSGGTTPVAGIVHALVLLAIVLVAAPLAAHIPLATLSAIVVMVSINMGEWHAIAPSELRRYSVPYRTILLATFFITVVFDLTLAVEIGLVLASLFFMYRIADLTRVERLSLPEGCAGPGRQVAAYRLSGSLFFGAANKLDQLVDQHPEHIDVVLLDLSKVINIDTTALDILRVFATLLKERNGQLILCGLNHQPGSLIERSGFVAQIGTDNVASTLDEALLRLSLNATEDKS